MGNSSKNKGDRAEREAVEYLQHAVPDLVVPRAQRMLGAGRADDVGDLRVLPDVAVQVRNYKLDCLGAALRSAAVDAVAQAANGDMPLALGMVPFPRARSGSVRWLASWVRPPVSLPVEAHEFASVSKAAAWVRDDQGPYGYRVWSREQRVAHLGGRGDHVFVAPAEAWLALYRQTRASGRHSSVIWVEGTAGHGWTFGDAA